MSGMVDDYLNGINVPNIARSHNRSTQTVYNTLKRFGVSPNRGGSNHVLDYNQSFLNDKRRNFLDGLILSDGHLAQRGCNAQLEIGQQFQDCRDYFIAPFMEYQSVLSRYKNAYRAITKCHPDFTQQRDRWYRDRKIIPSDLVLTPVLCLVWYLGDGNLKRSKSVRLATCGFAESEVRRMCTQLGELGITSNRQSDNTIYVTVSGTKKFFDFIAPAIHEFGVPKCYNYKFRVDYV